MIKVLVNSFSDDRVLSQIRREQHKTRHFRIVWRFAVDIMADTQDSLKTEDSPFNICPGNQITRIEFNEKLNIILAGSRRGDLFVVDPILGEVLYRSHVGELV